MSSKRQRGSQDAPGAVSGDFAMDVPENPTITFLTALAREHHEAGRLSEAERLYRESLAINPNHVSSLQSLGFILNQTGRTDTAAELISRACRLDPAAAEPHYNLGFVQMDQGKLTDAANSFRRALAINPDFVEAHNNLGIVLTAQGKAAEAIACYECALALKPDFAEGHNNIGAALADTGKLGEAVAHYERALSLMPNYADAHNNLGNALKAQGNRDQAVECYKRALALRPDYSDAYANLGATLMELNRPREAAVVFDRTLALRPDHSFAKFALCMAQLPVLYTNETEIAERRSAYSRSLDLLHEDVISGKVGSDFVDMLGSCQPFYLAYQGQNDRELQQLYGSLVSHLMADHYAPVPLAHAPEPTELIRVGIVSGFFRLHSNWKIRVKGWIDQLDRKRFQIFCYHTGNLIDEETKIARGLCDRFVQGPLSVKEWRQTIASDAPHVLIYPEVGMDGTAAKLAGQRLAPTQCVSWGHPVTSGFPTLDYFLSSELMEPTNSQDHYTERLVLLPNLSVYYEPLDIRPIVFDRARFGLRTTATVYWCGQSLYKYLPQFDQIFPRIAREVNNCQFAFIEFQTSAHVTELFQQRLERAFAEFGLRASDHCVFLPRLDQHEFVATFGACDVFLDSVGWSGANTTLESLAHDIPIVTFAGSLMRGRHSVAILKMIGVTETIATTIDEYISVAVRLGQDIALRTSLKQKIAKNKYRVYRDRTAISALESFLDDVVRRGTSK